MPVPSNGITAEVIREVMPPYRLSADLLQATLAALPAPPSDASSAWRQARLTRWIEEIVAPKPADADQARIAAEILIAHELANTLARRAHAPDQTTEQVCRLARAAAGLLRTAVSLDRSLARHQQKPVPFFGTVVQDEVDLAALDATWHTQPPNRDAEPPPLRATTPPPPDPAPRPAPSADHSDTAPPTADAARLPAVTPTPLSANTNTAEPPTPLDRSPNTATQPAQYPDTTPEWTITKLDEGPGRTREVLRDRSLPDLANAAAPGSAP